MSSFSVLLDLSLGPEGRCCSLEGGAALQWAWPPCSSWTLPGASRVRSPTFHGMILRHEALVKCICKTAYAACVHSSVSNHMVYLSSLSER